MDPLSAKYIAASFSMAIGSIAPAIAEGWVASKAMEMMGRNPEISDSLFSKMIVGMAICESTGIYCLVISLIILFVV